MRNPASEGATLSAAEARMLIDDIFEEEALVIGGLVAVHEIDDDLVWRLIQNLDAIRARTLRRLPDEERAGEAASREPDLRPHPAIEEFLLSLRRG